ncbi:MAG TPA: hypothetical protein VIT93_05530 [Dehalococcoidia bacterium]
MEFYLFWLPGLAVACAIVYVFLRAIWRMRNPRDWGAAEQASGISLVTWVASGALVIVIPVLGFKSFGSMGVPFMLLSSAGAFMASRYIRSAWCFLVPGGVLFGALWIFGLVALWAYKSGWQGLDIQDVSGLDQGEGTGIALMLVSGTIAAPFWGFFLGLLSHVQFRRPPTAPAAP